jgi:hypothetical protein
MASFTELSAIVVLHEPKSRLRKRIKREMKRVGTLRFLDVLAFRFYSRIFLDARNRQCEQRLLADVNGRYPDIPASTRILDTDSPNSPETEQLLRDLKPDIIIARCKNLLAERIFLQARIGTFVMHPGVCPEYRNAHGCFWALARRDVQKVGMTLLKINKGVDTGPVYGYFSYAYDELNESHIEIQDRVVFENLDEIRAQFQDIISGTAAPLNTVGRESGEWGQPWLSAYLRWKRAAHKEGRHDGRPGAPVP